jgi:hypothetical protein
MKILEAMEKYDILIIIFKETMCKLKLTYGKATFCFDIRFNTDEETVG